jgi:poly(3-hydroxybutyrate) depolymerase
MKIRTTFLTVAATIAMAISIPASQTAAQTRVFDETVPPGINYDKADFRLWLPTDVPTVQAVAILLTGSNGDGRPMAEETAWQDFANKNHVALVGVRITDKPHDQNFIEEYADVSRGSGQALLTALSTFAVRTRHPELDSAPLLLWGMSAGGEFNYEFVAWKPERVAAFVVNKGGIYYTALTSRQSRNVPGILFIGGKDLQSRINTITGLFEVNRRGGALWALAEEPGAAHVVGESIDVARIFFEDVLSMRVQGGAMKTLAEKDGFAGHIKGRTFQPASSAGNSNVATAWLPSERVARAWQDMVKGEKIQGP